MLETPTRGRYTREEKFLIFEPEPVYMGLVYTCIYGGIAGAIYCLIDGNLWWLMISFAVFLAGVWANLSVVRIRFDFKNRTYRRRQGPGLIPRLWEGAIPELDALVVLAEHSTISPGVVRYHLVLHWKQNRAPLMVLESTVTPFRGDLRAGGQFTVARASKFASSLQIPLYDNTHFVSPCPISVF